MATVSEIPVLSNFASLVLGGLTSLYEGAANLTEAQARINEVERLNATTDAELAKRGLKRDEIPHYVFRDMYYI